ncbi:pYEATS domain-containing protein [Phenylobacterium sp.]|uniref:pYEATS domain-containing protein n=1 Tax=Phenylobacterium sp. TaxID=1871053 RepID=UPI00356239DE
MTFLLRAPPDIAAANLRLIHPDGRIENLFATPTQNNFVIQGDPGGYTAIIEPLGQGPVSFGFDAPGGQTVEIQTPRLSELRAGDLRTTGFSPSAAEAPVGRTVAAPAGPSSATLGALSSTSQHDDLAGLLRESSKARPITIGLSQDTRPRTAGGWRPYRGPAPDVLVADGAVEVMLQPTQILPAPDKGARLRMSVAIAEARVERFLVPLFAGGVRIVFSASALTTVDVTMRVIPIESGRRALCQALAVGYADEARDIVGGFFGDVSRAPLDSRNDPWTAIVTALLAVRFPELSIPTTDSWCAFAKESASWIADAHILAAREWLDRGRRSEGPERERAAAQAIDALAEARRVGAPYFALSNTLMGDMLTSLASGAPGADNRERAAVEAKRWRRDITFRRSIGATFSWTMARRNAPGQKDRSLYSPTRGGLQAAYSKVLFRGAVDLDQIRPKSPATPQPLKAPRAGSGRAAERSPLTVQAGAFLALNTAGFATNFAVANILSTRKPTAAKRASTRPQPARAGQKPEPRDDDPPALRRRVRHRDDLNKGRFGGKSEVDGFHLAVSFDDIRGRWVYMTLSITAPEGSTESYVDRAIFFLHNSFDADRLTAVFRNDCASVSIVSYGGFTVGAWLPSRLIELELDLARVPGAPKRIQIY